MCINHGRAKYLPPVDIQTGRQTLEKKPHSNIQTAYSLKDVPPKWLFPNPWSTWTSFKWIKSQKKRALMETCGVSPTADWLIPEPLRPSHSRVLFIEGSLLTSQINFECVLTYIAIFRSTQTTISGHFAATLKHKCTEEEGEHLLKSDGRAIVAARRAGWSTSETAHLLWFSQMTVSRV